MSGVAAVWSRCERFVDRGVVSAMTMAMRERGPDGCTSWSEGTVAMSHLSFVTTPEAAREPQPFHDRERRFVVLLDGRIDNRRELQSALDGAVGRHDGDASHVAAVYRRWGSDGLARLIGDFAIVIWDYRDRRMVCARDVMGVRPLCYAVGRDGAFLVASEVRALLASGDVDDAINEARALEHLADRGQHRSETLFAAIHRVPPAHVLTATADAVTVSPYWRTGEAPRLRYGSDVEYAEHARALLGEVIREQSRAVGRVGVLLSGGIDSSAVAALGGQAGDVTDAFTVRFAGDPRDECAHARAVANAAGVTWHPVDYQMKDREWFAAEAERYRELPDYPNGAMLENVRERAPDASVRVLLTGVGGDEWFTGSPYRYADWLRGGHIVRALRAATTQAVRSGSRLAARDLLLCGAWPLLPRRIRAAVKTMHRPNPVVPEWIAPEAAARSGLADRIAVRVAANSGESFAHADTRLMATSGFQVHSDEMEDRAAARAGVEQRNPLYDRRVIDFAFSLPEEQRRRGTISKVVLRNAIVGIVPDSVRLRRDKAEFSATYSDALATWPATTFPQLAAREWVSPPAVDRLRGNIARWRESGDDRYCGAVGPFWMLHALELWLEGLRRSG